MDPDLGMYPANNTFKYYNIAILVYLYVWNERRARRSCFSMCNLKHVMILCEYRKPVVSLLASVPYVSGSSKLSYTSAVCRYTYIMMVYF